MKRYKNIDSSQYAAILKRPGIETTDLEETVKSIILEVQNKGDQALFDLTFQFDKVRLEKFLVSPEEIATAINNVDQQLKDAIEIARQNIEKFHISQKEEPQIIETMPGVQCWRKSVPIQKVGLYIPGGTAPLFSTVLMLGIPARIAGCEEIILCTPPQKDGSINPAILYSAQLIGISKIFKVGGAQAIAAMSFGTDTIPPVNKIYGPGNQYVTEAKQQVSRNGVAIDLPAGPSEVLVFADTTANPQFVAADLLSQAEHGVDSQVVLVTLEEQFVDQVLKAIEIQLETLPREQIAREALKISIAVVVKTKEEAANIINSYAPEHLILAMEDSEAFASWIKNAGSVFLGHYSPESVGDYASGTNHTLPTNGWANVFSGVSLDSFIKKITFQKITPKGLQNIGPAVKIMAEAEHLIAHKNAVSIRLAAIEKENQNADSTEIQLVNETEPSKLSYLIRSDIRTFLPYASARDDFEGQAEVFLDANENPFETGLNRYPDPMQKKLKSRIAAIKNTNASKVFLGNGSDEAIDLLIRLFCQPGVDSVITMPPTYGVYEVCAKVCGVEVKTLPLDINFQPDIAALKSLSFRASKILFICNPNNPTGSVIPLSTLKSIISEFSGIVVIDEAYGDFSELESCVSLIDQFPNLVVLQTFSKAWGLAGARLGMAFSQTEIIDWLNKIKLPYNINQLTQNEVLKRLSNKDEIDRQIQLIKAERINISKQLNEFAFVKKIYPSQANFILIEVNDSKRLYQFLLKKGIIVRDRSTEPGCQNCIRVTIGKPVESQKLLTAFKEFSKKPFVAFANTISSTL